MYYTVESPYDMIYFNMYNRYYITYDMTNNNEGKYIGIWIHKRHPIPFPHGQAVGVFWGGFVEKCQLIEA